MSSDGGRSGPPRGGPAAATPAPDARPPAGAPGDAPRLHGGPAIVTPDAVGLDVEVATVGSRGVAYIIDLLIFLTVLFLLSISQAILGGAGFVPGWFAIAVLLVLTFAWQFGYPIGFETLWRGRTPGKAALGLRVVTIEGAPVGVRHASVRAVVGLLELLGTAGIPAILTSLITSRSQRLGDLAAGTIVVRERRAASSPQVEVFAPPPGLEGYVAQLDVAGLRPADYATIRETLRRAAELPADVGHRVTTEVAEHLRPRVRPAPPAGCGAWAFLVCVAAAVQRRRAPGQQPPAGPGSSAGPSRPPSTQPPRSEPPGSPPPAPGPAGPPRSGPRLPGSPPATSGPPGSPPRAPAPAPAPDEDGGGSGFRPPG